MKHLYPISNRLQKSLFCYGSRKCNIIRARLRIGCSGLREHLCNYLHVIDSPKCQCGNESETVFHYFFECILFENQRQKMMQDLIPLTLEISTKTFLFGDTSKSLKIN